MLLPVLAQTEILLLHLQALPVGIAGGDNLLHFGMPVLKSGGKVILGSLCMFPRTVQRALGLLRLCDELLDLIILVLYVAVVKVDIQLQILLDAHQILRIDSSSFFLQVGNLLFQLGDLPLKVPQKYTLNVAVQGE